MMIAEVDAIFDLVAKAVTFCSLVQDSWYKGSAELEAFQGKILMLSAKHAQWSEQLQRYGVSGDKHLLLHVKLAGEALERQKESVRKLQKSLFGRLKKRAFPGQLSYLLDNVLQIVDAGPQLLAAQVSNADLLEKYTSQTPASLPFGQDANYVPIARSVLEMRSALESAEGPRVVTLYGGPGMGKSSLVKYLALHYQLQNNRLQMHTSLPEPAVFPDGVYYLFCGQHANKRVKQLQLELLQSLGFGRAFAIPPDSTSAASGGQADSLAIASAQVSIASRVAEQKLLIILDDLWEETVLQGLLVPAEGVKYLVPSQMRDIHIPAKKIQMRKPTHEEASRLMANYTDGLPERGQFPPDVQIVSDAIIRQLEYHPLSLANIGISINSTVATDTSHWTVIKENLYAHLDENDFRTPSAYDRPYNLPVSASMMLMVDSLPIERRRLLFLLALLSGQSLPEPLVKFFYSFLQPRGFAVKYNTHERFLEDKSLLELTLVEGSGPMLDSHNMRSHYIREKKAVELRSLGNEILVASGAHDVVEVIAREDTEGTLATILSAMYYEPSFKDVVASPLENHVKVINAGVIPRSLDMWAGTEDIVDSARRHEYKIRDLSWLLQPHHEGETWKQQAHSYAKKIIIKFVCQGKLDDDSLASLLRLPQTTSAACTALDLMCGCHRPDFYDQDICFSSKYGKIMQTLLALFHSNEISMKRRQRVITSLVYVLDYETEDTIFKVAEEYKALLAVDSDPVFQAAIIRALPGALASGRGLCTLADFPGLLEELLRLLVFGMNNDVRESAARAIAGLSQSRPIPLRIAHIPNALQMLFDSFTSEDLFESTGSLHESAGDILSCFTVPESRIKLVEIQGILKGLGTILAKLEEAWRAARDRNYRRKLGIRASVAAIMLGYLGLEKDARATIASLPGVEEGLIFLQLVEMATVVSDFFSIVPIRWQFYCSTRALTVLYSNPADRRSAMLPPVEDVLKLLSIREGAQSKSIAMAPPVQDICYFTIYWTRALAYTETGSYEHAISNLYLCLDHVARERCHTMYCCSRLSLYLQSILREYQIFLQAMQKDYSGALSGEIQLNLIQTAILEWLSGDLPGALEDFNAAAVDRSHASVVFKYRGYVKFLMGDKSGAQEDAESAQKQVLKERGTYEIFCPELENVWPLRNIPVSYLGFSF